MDRKIGSVLPQLSKSLSGLASLAFRGAGLSAAVAVLASSTGVLAQSTTTTTDSQKPDVVLPDGSNNGTTSSGARFTCEQVGGQYTVMYHPSSQPSQSFAWATPSAMGSDWTPQRRCTEISRRLESYRPDGLVELSTAVVNGYQTVCVTTEAVPSCRIVFTVPPGQDAVATRDRVFQNLTVADSGQSTQGVFTYAGGRGGNNGLSSILNSLGIGGRGGKNTQRTSSNIYLKPFLDRKDGGDGSGLSQLRRGTSNTNKPSNSRLNPNVFR